MKAEEFDKQFDANQEITAHLDLAQARRPHRQTRRVNVDFPDWMVEALDHEARRLGVPRQALIKVWLAERLEQQQTG
jgi:predicted DNA binding CopG/RHH family protein